MCTNFPDNIWKDNCPSTGEWINISDIFIQQDIFTQWDKTAIKKINY